MYSTGVTEEFGTSDTTETLSLIDEGRRFVMIENSSVSGLLTRYIHPNHQSSGTLETDENGDIITYEEYHPFGTTSFQAKNSSITASAKRYRYVGKERDAENGLYYFGARYYAAWTCRFISVDPLAGKFAQLSPYNYSENNPINDKDIDGQQKGDSKPSEQGGSSGNKEGGDQNIIVNGHEADLHRAEERVSNAIQGEGKAKDAKIQAQTRAERREASQQFRSARRELRRANRELKSVQSDFDAVKKQIESFLNFEKQLTYSPKMVEKLNKGTKVEPTSITVGDKINIMEYLKETGIRITVYNNKTGTRFKDERGYSIPAVNRNPSPGTFEIIFQNGGKPGSIFNEMGDIFFKMHFPMHFIADLETIDSMEKRVGNRQIAYERVYHELFLESFSAMLQTQGSRLINKK